MNLHLNLRPKSVSAILGVSWAKPCFHLMAKPFLERSALYQHPFLVCEQGIFACMGVLMFYLNSLLFGLLVCSSCPLRRCGMGL